MGPLYGTEGGRSRKESMAERSRRRSSAAGPSPGAGPGGGRREVRRPSIQDVSRGKSATELLTQARRRRSLGLDGGRASKQGKPLRQGELRAAFFQLSRDLSTLRWSWRDYILIDDLAEISILNPEARTHTVLVLAHGPLWRRRRLQVAFHALTLTQP